MSSQLKTEPYLIYIVDDDVICSEDLSEILSRNGYRVESFADALQFLSKMKEKTPDLILLDINLNQSIDGIELAHVIRNEYPVPIIYVSGYEGKHLLERMERTDPAAFLNKPINEKEVLYNVSIVLKRKTPEKVLEKRDAGPKETPKFLALKKGSRREKIDPGEIDYIEADGNYSVIHIRGERCISSYTLKKIEAQIPCDFLVRVHRKYIVNIRRVESITRSSLTLGTTTIPIGINYRSGLKQIFRSV